MNGSDDGHGVRRRRDALPIPWHFRHCEPEAKQSTHQMMRSWIARSARDDEEGAENASRIDA
jgi:hypothetical protein